MPINTSCTGCGKTLAIGDEHTGKRARCPACGQIYTVPPSSNVAPQSTSPIAPLTDSRSSVQPTSSADWASLENPAQADDQFWMQGVGQQIYGPVDRETLNRWFREGRIGLNYQIRMGQSGSWMDASTFRPDVIPGAIPAGGFAAAAQGNPYAPAAAPLGTGAVPSLHRYPKPDRGVLVLVMGILGFAICFPFGIVAIIMGRTALNDINAGLADPKDKTLVNVGFWLGVVNVVLTVLAVLLVVVLGIIGAVVS